MTKDCHGTTAEERLASGDHFASKQWYSLQFYYTRPIVFDIRWKSTNNRWDVIQALGYWWNIGYIGYDDNWDTKPNFSGGRSDMIWRSLQISHLALLFTSFHDMHGSKLLEMIMPRKMGFRWTRKVENYCWQNGGAKKMGHTQIIQIWSRSAFADSPIEQGAAMYVAACDANRLAAMQFLKSFGFNLQCGAPQL